MLQHFKEHWTRGMLRPCIYQSINRILFGVMVALLAEHFYTEATFPVRGYVFALLCGLSLLCLTVVNLRLGGTKVPLLGKIRFKFHKKPTRAAYGDMIDYTDEDIVNFDDLDDAQQDLCRVFAYCVCTVVFLIASFF